jgi:hypothetical protein
MESKTFLDQVRDVTRRNHYSIRTEEAWVNWITRFIIFHNKRHPKDLGTAAVAAVLPHLAGDGWVAASTPNHALAALLFLYRDVLGQDLPEPSHAMRAQESQHLPSVVTKAALPEASRAVYSGTCRIWNRPRKS